MGWATLRVEEMSAPPGRRQALAASAMWAANAATVSPGIDCADTRLHLTPANLHTMVHRALEADATHRALQCIFPDTTRFAVHAPLPAHPARFALPAAMVV